MREVRRRLKNVASFYQLLLSMLPKKLRPLSEVLQRGVLPLDELRELRVGEAPQLADEIQEVPDLDTPESHYDARPSIEEM